MFLSQCPLFLIKSVFQKRQSTVVFLLPFLLFFMGPAHAVEIGVNVAKSNTTTLITTSDTISLTFLGQFQTTNLPPQKSSLKNGPFKEHPQAAAEPTPDFTTLSNRNILSKKKQESLKSDHPSPQTTNQPLPQASVDKAKSANPQDKTEQVEYASVWFCNIFKNIGKWALCPFLPLGLLAFLFVFNLLTCCHFRKWHPNSFENTMLKEARCWPRFKRSWRSVFHVFTPMLTYNVRNVLIFLVIAFPVTRLVIGEARANDVWLYVATAVAFAFWTEVLHSTCRLTSIWWASWRWRKDEAPLIPGVSSMVSKFSFMGWKIRMNGDSRARIGSTRTIGLFGEWGCGKTTYLRQVEDCLSDDPNVIAVYYDAWRWQSACPPEFALLDEIFRSPRIMKMAWFKKPFALSLVTVMRSIRISISGFEFQSEAAQNPHIQRYELSLLARAYQDLFAHLYRSGFSLLLLIDEADRCERLYFQSILTLLPRYLNENNCFTVVSLVSSNLDNQLFLPLDPPVAPPSPPSPLPPSNNAQTGQTPTSTCQPETSPSHLDTTQRSNKLPTVLDQASTDSRFQPDLRDSLLAAKRSFGNNPDAFKRHVLSKFFEELRYLPPLTDGNDASEARFLELIKQCLIEWSFPTEKIVERNPYIQDIIHLANGKLGWGGNPRLFTGALKSIAPMIMQAMETTGLKPNKVQDWPLLLRMALGCLAYLQLHESALLAAGPEACKKLYSAWMKKLSHEKHLALSLGLSDTPSKKHENQSELISNSQLESQAYDFQIEFYQPLRMTLLSTVAQEALQIITLASYAPFVSTLDEICRVYLMSRQHYLVSKPSQAELARELLDQGRIYADMNRNNLGNAAYDECVRLFGGSPDPEILKQVAVALVNKGIALGKTGNTTGELAAYSDCIERFSDRTEPEILKQVAMALVNKGNTLGRSGKAEEEVTAYDECVRRFGSRDETDVLKQVAKALLNKGVSLGRSGKKEEEIAAYDECVRRFGNRTESALLEQVARSLVNKGVSLGESGKAEEAVAAYDECVKRFGNHEETLILEPVAKALFNKGNTLDRSGKAAEAVAAYDECAKRFSNCDEPTLLEPVAMACFNMGNTLDRLGKTEEAVAVYDECVKLLDNHDESALLEPVAMALINKGVSLNRLGKAEEAINAYNECIKRFGSRTEPALLKQVAMALLNKGNVLGRSDKTEEAVAVCDECIRLFSNRDEPEILKQVAMALVNKGILLNLSEKTEEAVASFDECVRRFGGREEPELLETVARSLFNKGSTLDESGKTEEAITAYDDCVRRLGGRVEPELLKPVAIALLNKGKMLDRSGNTDEAIATYDDCAKRFEGSQDKDLLINAVRAEFYGALIRCRRFKQPELMLKAKEIIAKLLTLGESRYNTACYLALCGERDNALVELKACLETKETKWAHVAIDPDWNDFRPDPRYKELEKQFATEK